jgi:hypothetical protein
MAAVYAAFSASLPRNMKVRVLLSAPEAFALEQPVMTVPASAITPTAARVRDFIVLGFLSEVTSVSSLGVVFDERLC